MDTAQVRLCAALLTAAALSACERRVTVEIVAAAPAARPAAVAVDSPPAAAGMHAVAAPAATAARPAWVLLGTVVTPQGRYAVLQTSADAPVRQLRIGERIDRWELTGIAPGRVTLVDTVDGAAQALALNTQAPSGTANAAAMPHVAALPAPTHYTEPEVVVLGH